MIRHQIVTSRLRFHLDPNAPEMAPYDATCGLMWESPTVIWIEGLHGNMPRPLLRDLVQFCLDHGIQTIKAHREPGRRLPFGRERGDHTEIAIQDAAARVGYP